MMSTHNYNWYNNWQNYHINNDWMIRMVPEPKLPNSCFETNANSNCDLDPNHSLEQIDSSADLTFIDFDLGLLPSSECEDLEYVPCSPETTLSDFSPFSPSDQACLSPNLATDLDCSSVTMFSPGSGMNYDLKVKTSYIPMASPLSLPPSSPYSPGSRQTARFSSTDSTKTTASSSASSSAVNLKEELSELADLQRVHGTQSVLKRALEEGTQPQSKMIKTEPKEEFDSMLSMVIDQLDLDLLEHVRKEIKSQSSMLNIHPNPSCWSQSDVARWLRHKMQELKIPATSCQPALQWAANFEGPGFVQVTEDEFKARLPEGGEQIYSALDMWRNAAAYSSDAQLPVLQHPQQQQLVDNREEFDIAYVLDMLDNTEQVVHQGVLPPPPDYSEVVARSRPPPPSFEAHMASMASNSSASLDNSQSSINMPPIEELLKSEQAPPPYPGSSSSMDATASTLTTLQPPMSHGSSTANDMTEDEEADENADETESLSPGTRPAPGPIRGSSSNIHLWQFVKELLNQPQHSGCIHWVDREQGIFKIVDSVRVAELWGKRKNRPAMNFDKLSRSLRQYYKKGIMKKTSRPQRLVYQFCTPYHL